MSQQIILTRSQTISISKPGTYEVVLSQPHIEVDIRGGWLLKDKQQAQVDLQIIHQAPHTTSHITLKAVTDDQAQINFTGTIVVEKKAQQTNAFLTANVLLLSPQAWATAKPNLEIEADDVKCSHAATVSEIPPQQLFYLCSRGIDKQTAQELIVEGFLAPTKVVQPDLTL